MTIRGYTDRPNAAPGETVGVHVSAAEADYTARLVRLVQLDLGDGAPPPKIFPVDEVPGRVVRGHRRRTQVGNYVTVTPSPVRDSGASLTFSAFVQPTLISDERQTIASVWDDSTSAGWSVELHQGHLSMVIGDGAGTTERVTSEWGLFEGIWYEISAVWDAQSKRLAVHQSPLVNSTNSRFGPVVPLDSAGTTTATEVQVELSMPQVPLLLGGVWESGSADWVIGCFNGKLDSPRLVGAALDDAAIQSVAADATIQAPVLAHWDFAEGIESHGVTSDIAHDVSGNGHHGRCHNQPDRAVTGRNWSGRRDQFTDAPGEYGAIWLHADSLEDCRWPEDFSIEIPSDLSTGCYAVHVQQGEEEDYIPFFVRPADDAEPAPIAVLMPTLSYVVYANYHNVTPWSGWGYDTYEIVNGVFPLETRDLEMMRNPDDYGRSVYDHHVDGRGVIHGSWRRPILDMRPGMPFSFNFQSDFYLIDWLEHSGFQYDVITDHDLHEQGADLLRQYSVVVTGSHPEYYTWEMLDAFEQYFADGGRGMYLGGNGFYWVTALHPEKPWLAEVRRGETGDTAWKSRPGEYYHAFTGERGGLWRHRGRPPQKIWGTGYGAHTLGTSGYYVRMPDSMDDRVAWMFEGIKADEIIGEIGLVGGGAAAIEIDSYDLSLGTPPHTLLLGSSVCHDQGAMLVPEEVDNPHPGMGDDEHPKIRADITYFTTSGGGGVFTTSAIGWSGALPADGYRNAAACLTANVLSRFADPEPLEAITEEQER